SSVSPTAPTVAAVEPLADSEFDEYTTQSCVNFCARSSKEALTKEWLAPLVLLLVSNFWHFYCLVTCNGTRGLVTNHSAQLLRHDVECFSVFCNSQPRNQRAG